MSRQARQVPQWSASGCIGRQLGGGQDGADEEPRAQLARHEIGVLALPAQTRLLRQRLLHQRRRVDEDLDLGAGAVRQPLRQALELALDHVMVIAIQRIDGDDAGVPVLQALPSGRVSGA